MIIVLSRYFSRKIFFKKIEFKKIFLKKNKMSTNFSLFTDGQYGMSLNLILNFQKYIDFLRNLRDALKSNLYINFALTHREWYLLILNTFLSLIERPFHREVTFLDPTLRSYFIQYIEHTLTNLQPTFPPVKIPTKTVVPYTKFASETDDKIIPHVEKTFPLKEEENKSPTREENKSPTKEENKSPTKAEKEISNIFKNNSENADSLFNNSSIAYIWRILRSVKSNKYYVTRTPINRHDYEKWFEKNRNNSKTELCYAHFFLPNGCVYESCQFAHKLEELREIVHHINFKALPCKMFQKNGTCKYGRRCHYVHNIDYFYLLQNEFTLQEYLRIYFEM